MVHNIQVVLVVLAGEAQDFLAIHLEAVLLSLRNLEIAELMATAMQVNIPPVLEVMAVVEQEVWEQHLDPTTTTVMEVLAGNILDLPDHLLAYQLLPH